MSALDKAPRLYSSTRRGYMRATREEGIRAELDAINEEARGTPFFGSTTQPPSASAPAAELAERLAALTRRPR